MHPIFRANFKNHFKDITCSLKCNLIHLDTQENALMCSKIKEQLDTSDIKYSFLYEDIFRQNELLKTYIKIIDIKEKIEKEIMENQNLNSS